MMWTNLAALLLASQVSAGLLEHIPIARRQLNGDIGRYASDAVSALHSGPIERRQAPAPIASNGTFSGNGTAWNEATSKACMTALTSLNGVASSTSGMAICYNLPFLDNSTGVFQADLRLFKVSNPSGDFVNIPNQDIVVGLQYVGATVQMVNPGDLTPRSLPAFGDVKLVSWPVAGSLTGGELVEKRQSTTAPTLAQTYAFIGQLNKNIVSANLNSTALMAVLLPSVSLSARSASGTFANTTLSTNEATFLVGAFSANDPINPSPAGTTASGTSKAVFSPGEAQAIVDGLPYVVIGTQGLQIFPIGLVITSVWAVAGAITVGYGTYGRARFRESFRQRSARAERGNLARI